MTASRCYHNFNFLHDANTKFANQHLSSSEVSIKRIHGINLFLPHLPYSPSLGSVMKMRFLRLMVSEILSATKVAFWVNGIRKNKIFGKTQHIHYILSTGSDYRLFPQKLSHTKAQRKLILVPLCLRVKKYNVFTFVVYIQWTTFH